LVHLFVAASHYRTSRQEKDPHRHMIRSSLSLVLSTATLNPARSRISPTTSTKISHHQLITVMKLLVALRLMAVFCTPIYKSERMLLTQRHRLVMCMRKYKSVKLNTVHYTKSTEALKCFRLLKISSHMYLELF